MVETVAFFVSTVLGIAAPTVIMVVSGGRIVLSGRRATAKQCAGLKRGAFILAAAVLANMGLILFSQSSAMTPRIRDEAGSTPAGSIAELVQVELNGRKEWISIRGLDRTNPVLLFLAGGPGGTQMATVRHELPELEEHFVVVGWDQPGSGKSYDAEPIKNLTAETYIQDGYALTGYLRGRFGQERIYLVGESWGSALGIFLIDRYPDCYHGFICTGQMVDFAETERMDDAIAMDIARENSDAALLKKLAANGAPPTMGGASPGKARCI